MENLDTGKDKIKKICEVLKNETLQPAREEAKKILEVAEQEARHMIRDAEKKGENILEEVKKKIEKERQLFENSLKQAFNQGIESLRQEIENKLFNASLADWLGKEASDKNLVGQLIEALVGAIEREGTSANFSAIVPKQLSADQVNAILLQRTLSQLREKSVIVGDFTGGAQLKLHDRKLTLDLSNEALQELIGHYLRKDFREILFGS